MKNFTIDAAQRKRASRAERAISLLRLWYQRPDLLLSILTIKGAPSRFRHPARWFDLASRMLRLICCVNWTLDQKVRRIIDHHRVTRRLGGILAQSWDDPRKLMDITAIGPEYSLKIDEAYWMTGDGLTTLSLWHGIDRMFTVGFLLSQENGRLTAYIGGLQGRDGALQLYRDMTKDAKGMRPRDLMVESFRMFCSALGVTEIRAIADLSRSWHDRFADEEEPCIASLNYDEAWEERGGQRSSADWFSMPIAPQRRNIEDIPSKKRSLYRQRYAMLNAMEADMARAVRQLVPGTADARTVSLRPAEARTEAEERVLV